MSNGARKPQSKSSCGYQEDDLVANTYCSDSENVLAEKDQIYERIASELPEVLTGFELITLLLTRNIVADEEGAMLLINHMRFYGLIKSNEISDPLMAKGFDKSAIFSPVRKSEMNANYDVSASVTDSELNVASGEFHMQISCHIVKFHWCISIRSQIRRAMTILEPHTSNRIRIQDKTIIFMKNSKRFIDNAKKLLSVCYCFFYETKESPVEN